MKLCPYDFLKDIYRMQRDNPALPYIVDLAPYPRLSPPSNTPPCQSLLFTISPPPMNKPPWSSIEFKEKVEMNQYMYKSLGG